MEAVIVTPNLDSLQEQYRLVKTAPVSASKTNIR